MKSICVWALGGSVRMAVLGGLALVLGASLQAAEKKKPDSEKAEATGSLLYANAVAEKGWSFLVLDGQDLLPEGIAAGYRSSWVRYPVGPRALQFEHQPLGLVDLTAELQADGLHAFIAYADLVSQKESGRPPRPVLAIKELRCDLVVPKDQRRETHLLLLNLTLNETLQVRINEERVELPRLKETLVTPAKRSGVLEVAVLAEPEDASAETDPPRDPAVSAAGEPLHTQRINVEDAGTRFVVYYAGAEGEVESLLFDDVGMHGSAQDEAP